MDSGIFFGGSVIAATVAGVIALFAPCCISVMLPSYFASAFPNRTALTAMTFVFAAGVASVILPIAMGASAIRQVLSSQHTPIYLVAGGLMLGIGVYVLLGGRIHLPMPGRRAGGRAGPWSVYTLGIFSGVASSCCAPVLAGVIALSSVASGFGAALGLGAAYVFGMALLSYLKPTLRPLEFPRVERPLNKPFEAARLEDFVEPWVAREIVFTQETVEYSARGKQASAIPGFILRVPNGMIPASVGDAGGGLRRGYAVVEANGQTYSLMVNSRICPHLGCIFQYHTPAEVCSGFNYCGEQARGKDGHNLYSCPCHLSVYDPTQTQVANGLELPGRVVSGPAPRPPFPFDFTVRPDGTIIIEAYGNG